MQLLNRGLLLGPVLAMALLLQACPQLGIQFVFGPTALDFGVVETELEVEAWSLTETEVTFTLTTQTPWITGITPAQAQSSGPADRVTFTVEVSREGLAPGTHQGELTLNAGRQTETIPVSITVPAEDELEAFLRERLGEEISDFYLVQLDVPEIAAAAERGQVSLPAVQADGTRILVDIQATHELLRHPDLTHGALRSGHSTEPEVETVALPPEQNFLLGDCGRFVDRNEQMNPGCGMLTIMDVQQTVLRGMVVHPEVGVSYVEPVRLLLGTREFPGLEWDADVHIVYHHDNAREHIFSDEEEPPLPPREAPREKAAVEKRVDRSTSVVLDGDVTFYELDPDTVWSRQESAFFISRIIYGLIEPFTNGEFALNLQIKGQEVWISGGPTTTNSVALIDEITDPNYFVLNPVTEQELHYLFVGYNVSGVYGRAAGIGTSANGFGNGTRNNRAFSEARASQSFKTVWVVLTHELGHVLGGRHGDGVLNGCITPSICGPSIMPAGSAGAPDTRKPYFSETNAQNIAAVLEATLP